MNNPKPLLGTIESGAREKSTREKSRISLAWNTIEFEATDKN
jgi:hypothetical protein